MSITRCKIILLPLLLIMMNWALASTSPVTMLTHVSQQMLAQLQKNKHQIKRNPQLVEKIVDQILVPRINVYRMAGAVLGRQYWLQATPAQKQAFINQFKKLVIGTYADALASYNDDRVKFYPLRGNLSQRRTVRVNSVIIRKTGQQIAINYNMVANKGQWKVYDFSIEGVSIVQSYRSQFAATLANGGLPLLINRLAQHNRSRSS